MRKLIESTFVSLNGVEGAVPEGFPVRSGGERAFGDAPFQEATLGFG